jgi:tetratricopeptide (TPR) repeat protein
LLGRLQEWAATETPRTPWTIYLAQLLVELDRLEEAIDLYQVRGDKDLLTVNEWYQLSLWQHALDRRAESERSKRKAWARTPSNELQKQLTNELEQWNSGGIEKTPTAPESVKERFAILLPKTEHPDHAIRLLANWYKATHDSQLLVSMASFVTGQSRGKMRDALEYTQSAINDVDQEAGIDAIEESIRQTEIRVKSPADRPQSEIDLLALNILSLQTASAGARITNQPGSHVERATSILGQLLKHNWQPDERQWFALRLHNLPINNVSLKQTRLEGMQTLLQAVPEGSTERLQIAKLTAQVMINEKDGHDASRLLEAEINSALGMLPKSDAGTSADSDLVVDLVRTLVHLLHEARQYQASERLLTETTRSLFIPDREELLFDTHVSALLHGGRTSLGEKSSLYESLKNQTLARVLEAEGSDEFQRAWRQLIQVLRSGQHQRIKAVAVDTLAIAKTHATDLVRRHSDRDDEIIDAILKLLKETDQRQAAIEFLLERLESQPLALQWTVPRQRWNNFADDLYATAVQTNDTKNGGKHYELYPEAIPLRDRFEDVLFLGLEMTFAVLGDQHSELFSAEKDELWKDGNKRFLEMIDRVAAANPDSQPHLMHLANRLISHHHGQRETAIRILRSANDRKVLDVNGQNQLVSYLFDAQQFEDAVRVLDNIIQAYPNDTTPRISLMTALYRLGDRERLLAELNNILKELLDPETADVQRVWSLADSCRECELWKEASDLYNRGITRHGWPRSPSPPLSDAWRNLAECQARLNQTADALNSVSAAWVVCGQDASRRNYVQSALTSVMSQTQDLTAVTELLDQKASKDGDDSSFLRRALGKALLDKSSFESAEAQLRIALSLQPQDNEAWSWLIAALDGQGRFAEAITAVQDQSDTNIRDISLYQDLHERIATLKLPDEAERAATSLIEVAMTEPDHHMSLAQIRESQDLQNAALNHWQIASDLKKEDPTPLAGLAKAQIRMGDPAAARRTLNRLVISTWDERFKDLPNELRSIRRQLRKQERAER